MILLCVFMCVVTICLREYSSNKTKNQRVCLLTHRVKVFTGII